MNIHILSDWIGHRKYTDYFLFYKLILCADYINLENSTTRKEFIEYYGREVSKKTKLGPYGMELLDDIDEMEIVSDNIKRKELNIPPHKIIVTCGYNAHSAHQHLQLVEALGNISDDVKEKIVCAVRTSLLAFLLAKFA